MKKYLVIEQLAHDQFIEVFNTLEEARSHADDIKRHLTAADRPRTVTVANVDESCLCDWYEPEEGEPIDWTCVDSWGKSICEEFEFKGGLKK